MSLLVQCRQGLVPAGITAAAERENVPGEALCRSVGSGQAVVTSPKRGILPVAIGAGLRKKFGVIVGASSTVPALPPILAKARLASNLGATAIHDGSLAGDIKAIHEALLAEIDIPVGFCHPGRVAALCARQGRDFLRVEPEEFLSLLEEDAAAGCELLPGPFAVTMRLVERMSRVRRVMPSPNKTGSLMISWMRHNNRENPYIEHFDRVLAVARKHEVVLSFVNGFRPGCIADAMDELQLEEIRETGSLIRRAHQAGVQAKAGGGGHVPLDKIGPLLQFERECVAAPIISFGPLVTDVSIAFDHVTAAVGQAQALLNGAAMVLTITAAEHLGLPSDEEVNESCIIARHVCHSVDLANGRDLDQDFQMSLARERLDWGAQLTYALDRAKAESLLQRDPDSAGCSMCGRSCAYLAIRESGAAATPVASVRTGVRPQQAAEVLTP